MYTISKKFKAAVLAGIVGIMGISGTAQAVNVNPDGLGQVLLYPYYTVNGGNMTLLSLTNTTDQAKAVKVRFLEGQNSREVLDFNLYLSANDMWVAAVSNIDGVPTLTVPDTSCTTPYLYMNDGNDDGVRDGQQPFLPYAFEVDGGSTDMIRATEGHFEIIEMGVVVNDVEDSADAVTHVDGFPADCDQLQEAWTDGGYWVDDPAVDMRAPTGGLFGSAAVLNVELGTMYSFNATAINGWADTLDANDFLHQRPGTVLPSLNSGNITTGVVFLDDGGVYTSPDFTRGVDAVSFVLMHNQIMNEYNVESDLAANSEWVITFPTKGFYVDVDMNGGTTDPVAPFTSIWFVKDDPETKDVDESVEAPACEVVSLNSVWDREEATVNTPNAPPVGPVVSPSVPPSPGAPAIPFELCFETNVIRFGVDDLAVDEPTEILGSYNYTNFDVESLGFSNGWAKLELVDYAYDVDGDGVLSAEESALRRASLGGLSGLPVVGFKVERYVNSYVANPLETNGTRIANYGGSVPHKGTREADPE
jgi:hypothetical protein